MIEQCTELCADVIERRPHWIRTAASDDLLNSLEHCLLCLTLTRSDEQNWKWCVAAAHSAAQIAMVMVLLNGLQHEHLEEPSRKAFREAMEKFKTNPTMEHWPKMKLASFMALYKACVKYLPSETATPEQEKDIRKLHNLRNMWTHFGNGSSSVSIPLARMAVRTGIKLVVDLSPIAVMGFHGPHYENHTDKARHEVAISSLLRLTEAGDADDEGFSDDEDARRYAERDARWEELFWSGALWEQEVDEDLENSQSPT